MTQIISVFRKDARHLWPQILVFVALVLLAAVVDPTYTRRELSTAESLIWTALPLACWNLVIAAIHEERLPGDRQYWLVRPYSRAGLLTAKALFLVAFVNLPVLLIQAASLPKWEFRRCTTCPRCFGGRYSFRFSWCCRQQR